MQEEILYGRKNTWRPLSSAYWEDNSLNSTIWLPTHTISLNIHEKKKEKRKVTGPD